MSSVTTTIPQQTKNGYVRQVITIGIFFFIFGFITWINGTLIPYLRIACELKEWQAYLVTFAYYISYTIFALPSSRVLKFTGMIGGMRLGLIAMAGGCFIFIPAAITRYYPLFLIALFIVGAGLTILQTAVNPYITLIGTIDKAAQRMSIMGICNKFAGIIAPLILGSILLNNADDLILELKKLDSVSKAVRLDQLARAVIFPYIILTVVLLLIAFMIRYAHLPEIATSPEFRDVPDSETDRKTVTHKSNYILGFIAVFCTVGLEVVAGDTIANYGLFQGLRLDIAKNLTSLTLATTLAGYLFGALAIPRLITQQKAYLYTSVIGIGIVILVLTTSGLTSVGFVALLGLSNAILWPAIWPQALKGLSGIQLNRISAILIMGIAGGAIMPLVYAWVSNYTNNRFAYFILIPCYLFNLYYGLRGIKKRDIETNKLIL
jgi:MFS transporter, FHS family, L-fucose permease